MNWRSEARQLGLDVGVGGGAGVRVQVKNVVSGAQLRVSA